MLAKIFFNPFNLSFGPVFAAKKIHPFFSQGGKQHVVEDAVLAVHGFVGNGTDRFEKLIGQHAIGAGLAGMRFQFVLQAGHANFEELIHVAGKNQQEIQPLHQGMILVHGLLKDAQVELQQAEFPVQVVVRVVEVAAVEVDGALFVDALFAGERIHGVVLTGTFEDGPLFHDINVTW